SVKDISVAVKWGALSLDVSFRRRARDGAESNQWSEFWSMLDSVTLSSSSDRIFCDLNGEATRWVKTVPIKVKILAWRTRLDRLLTQVNLITRGVNIDSSLCPVCRSVQEDSNHLFFLCDLGKSISQRICRWWNIQWVEVSTYAEWNRVVFDSSLPRRVVIFDDIVATSFIWSVNRCSCSFSWEFWLKNPILISL
nr:RNA-directed DNA polymerase, eukaryota [Tanacetum cinerariifolium]